ncbi:MAG: NADH-quinone oxidoreductase subunit NuoH [Acidimicrobiia bacterium]|nr:NADH-quinone oxidoreductase subunit NuoH [Acidimicrobiia bacterium]MYC57703.1 NADH-quinone oxidoreductase subunit NuoH [Acidimicrobiia bacterium]MYG93607.1 NADH-quinone oxidoreductase subunit NuoH [Acidimicrobiia bacterium]MYI30902.1 NADH-quinone oxidoreductase subunit NuoH [Acidimicrobiia bacterium]
MTLSLGHVVFGLDPLYLGGVGLDEVFITLLKVVVAFGLLLMSVMLMIWFERKLISDMQNRIGPSLAGPFGVFQTLADGIKLFFKEDLIPERSDRLVFKLAPYLSLVPAFLVFAVVPVGGDFNGGDGRVTIFGHDTFLQVADPPVGILFVLAMSSLAVYGVMLAGWSSGSKYPLLASVRASAQMVSYEAALGLSLVAVLLKSGSLSTNQIVSEQSVWNWNLWVTWLVPMVVFLIAATAELNRPPFDLVEAEQELVGGFHTEYSSLRFALFFLAEFMNTITMSAIIVTLFLGGPNGPDFTTVGWLSGVLWFFIKLMLFLFIFVWFRATLPRIRYDQLMDLGWKLLIPVSLGWLMLLACYDIAGDRGWNRAAVVVVTLVVMAGLAGLLVLALRAAKQKPKDAHDDTSYERKATWVT